MNLIEAIRKLPKTDLHCHLDGSLRAETILEIAKKEKVDIGTSSLDALRKKLVCGEKVSDLGTFLGAFDLTCSVLQSREAIERISFELAEDAAHENVRVLEVRFAPILAVKKGLTLEEVMQAARAGLARAEAKYPIRTGLIVCALRNLSPAVSMTLARLAAALKSSGIVVGFDLAHAERGNPPAAHADAFRIAKEAGLGLTVHAGEDYGPESIQQAIEMCGAQRIGHALTLEKDANLEALVKEQRIPLECCPSSNVQISLSPSWKDHPFARYLRKGLLATLNTDNRLLTGITVTDEYIRAREAFDLSWEELVQTALNGFEAAFLPEHEKTSLVRDIRNEIDAITAS